MLLSGLAWEGRARARAAAPPPQKTLAEYDPQVDELLSKLTLDEKIGQMTQPDQQYLKSHRRHRELLRRLAVQRRRFRSQGRQRSLSWTDLYDRFSRALQAKPRIPLLYGIDAVHGHNNVLGAVVFPHNIGLGCTRNPKLVEQVQRITAEEVRATGIQWAFAPCVTVPQDIRWGRTYEGF